MKSLPHLYGWPWYQWAHSFFKSMNKQNLICAANQISKSSTQIRKCIEWGGNQKLWPNLWATKPTQFWYLYPSSDVATIEFETKWVPEFLPRGEMKEKGPYAWRARYDKDRIHSIEFLESGVICYFKNYSQKVSNLQTATVYAIFCDEELPHEYYDELQFRLTATNGYFHMVCTPTLGQDFWRRVFEEKGDRELLPDAFKLNVSMYDCLVYSDGAPTPWTEERIKDIEKRCKNEAEVQRRVYGRFVKDHGRKFPTYDPETHLIKPIHIPFDWKWYSAVDIGSGDIKNSKAAIIMGSISPDFKRGYIVKCWRGDNIITTSADILARHRDMQGNINFVGKVYDYGARDFGTIQSRQGEGFLRAEKAIERGEDLVNTLFKNGMLHIFESEEAFKLSGELLTVSHDSKKKQIDDLTDALRYWAIQIPWDWDSIKIVSEEAAPKELNAEDLKKIQIRERRGEIVNEEESKWKDVQEEIDYWNDEYGN